MAASRTITARAGVPDTAPVKSACAASNNRAGNDVGSVTPRAAAAAMFRHSAATLSAGPRIFSSA
ncbi:hypothetical protein HQ312_00545 [Rhodococcus sp. BP-316]|uniref:hypothetical protein n=1 Tax=Rhodococcus sp. BP-316 TaxID=2739445 RepID=UPI001C9B162F|nr:hypothetical protein [Rhodococcus sp. BP-316]MBY6679529.1 hypothetical protein [Rhodococcus sp. BP-316]